MTDDLETILAGYAQGYFLMADEESGELDWYSSRSRTLIPLDQRFHVPRSLRPILNKGLFTVAIDRAFPEVVEGCAQRPETWISDELKAIYLALYQAGHAHSFETWQEDTLAAGILGITLGSAFVGESMFYAIPNASKVAMVELVRHLNAQSFTLFDAQLPNPHLDRFGSFQISQRDYLRQLQKALADRSIRFR
ncbi:MAG: leucyl/phenylalanyl-tRNA--protein transferase [Synechococcaceae cyanobacterium SM2_3_2]|nr:leucyl/phenylalanyl-tRNA--protein transferase [Synechococcaceae cyanobacterium SM2_3_2]